MSHPAIWISELSHRYEPLHPAIEEINLSLAEGTWAAITGQNGAGKTTLVKHINGLLKPSSGSVIVNGMDTRQVSVSQLARHVGYVFQNPDHQIFCATCREEIAFGPRNLGEAASVVRERVDEALALFGLEPLADHPPALLSYGQRRLVALAAVLAMQPQILILDEPTVGLDAFSADSLLQIVQRLHRQGHTIVLVTHEMGLAASYAQEMVVMVQGRILLQGSTGEVLAQPEMLERADLEPPQITALCQSLAKFGLPRDALTVTEATQAILARLGHRS